MAKCSDTWPEEVNLAGTRHVSTQRFPPSGPEMNIKNSLGICWDSNELKHTVQLTIDWLRFLLLDTEATYDFATRDCAPDVEDGAGISLNTSEASKRQGLIELSVCLHMQDGLSINPWSCKSPASSSSDESCSSDGEEDSDLMFPLWISTPALVPFL